MNTPKKSNHVIGQATAVAMGAGIGAINIEHGPILATIAGLKQYFYSAVVAVVFIEGQHRIYDHFKEKYPDSIIPDVLAITLPAAGTIAGTFALHALKGTPETLASTIPTIIFAPIGYTILQIRRRLKESKI